ncbi:polymorphic toxin-type HINT domain-containing protein [Lentzea nigeriaca]|uniref:polymorphic toxin-type HINT domain-containing protein n=1 Tax=Lentzea nigeriaca TaxID=1128665 RepID=UPI001956D2D0|nr:polymorphic toxin-type HINT domain-containing protein [Lentzea nigeriaca]MBM7858061.1 RHS repeat-associated protein [Lentzea nigeriaca]
MPTALPRRGLAVALAASLVTTVLTATPPPVVAAPYKPPVPAKERVIAGKMADASKNDDVRTGKAFTGGTPVWPKAGVAEVDLGASAAKVSDTPLTVAAAETAVTARGARPRIKIETFDQEKARKAGVEGLLFKISGGSAKIEVDYSSFRWAYGADWASRLRLVELPECALSTPDKPECAAKPVASRNDAAKNKVTATQASPAAVTFMALTAGTSSGSGSYKATSLSPSATWSAGSNTGGFSWNYPLRMPPSLGGPTPSLALAYSSASVDGRMAASNNQPSWIGEGFDLGVNFIERKYVGCSGDMADGARNTVETGDLCWRSENATLSMTGHGGELIKEAAPSNRWRLRNDDGTRVELRPGADNGARNGEHWVVTTPDGTQHWFGRGAQSVLNVPVAGNHAGEPCAAPLFKDSFCSQPYRWNLDYVVDTHGNTMTYSYDKETNKYGRNNSRTDLAEYDRASVLKQIDYGTRNDRTESAPMQVVLEPADRCLADCGTKDAQHWPDVPWDQECAGSTCLYSSPTFWGTKRLASVTTKVGGNAVEKWTLTHSFPDPGDGTRAGLWLDKISRVGLVGQQTTVPDVRFRGIQLSNRVDTHSDQLAAMKWWRLKTIFTESGGQIDVTYSEPDCVVGSRMPNRDALQDNNLRCYPVRWTPPGDTTPIWDFFHKYVVTSMTESDLTGGSTRVLTQYDYVGDPAWHYSDDDGFVKAEDKTWSVWRGYGAVKTRLGDPGEQTLTERRYFRGMHGDKLPSGTRTVSMPAIAVGNVAAVNDEDAFASMMREEIIYNGPDGAEVSATVNGLWQSEPTASRMINGVTVHARHVQSSSKHSRTALDSGRGFRTTSQVTGFDQAYGLATQTEDRGDDAVTGDEKCILIDYVHNTSDWVIGKVSRKRDFLVDCGKANAGTGLQDADIAGDLKTYYDGQDHGAPPTRGEPTKSETLKSYVNATAAYLTESSTERDVYGRVTKLTDPKGTTSTAYTPSAGGPVTQITTTNTLGWATTTTVEPAWGSPVSTTDPNLQKAFIEYDGLGRTTAVWKPGQEKTNRPAYKKFSYLERTDRPSVVATSVMANGQYVTSRQLFDGLLRPRQTQQPDATGSTSSTVITDTFYDSAGRAKRTNNPYSANVASGNDLFVPTEVIPTATVTTYDGAGRAIAQALKKKVPVASPGGDELFRTTTYYAGDRTDVTPPAGGVVQSTLIDVLGRKSELRHYHSGVVAGAATGFDATTYTYDLQGRLTEVAHPSGKTWQYTYDVRGRQIRVVDPDKGTTESTYDDADQLTSTKDGRGKAIAHTYDALGRKTSTRDDSPTGPLRTETFYDVLASGISVKGAQVKSVRHGELGDYVTEHKNIRPDTLLPTSTDITIPAGETGLGGTYNYVYSYNDDDQLLSTRIPAVGDLKRETLQYEYDALGQPKVQLSGYGTSPLTGLVTSTTYTPFGELSTYELRNGISANPVNILRDYDDYTRRLVQIWTTKLTGPTDVANVSYSHDWAGNVTRVSDSVSSDTQCFRTDYLRRLTEAWTPESGNCDTDPTVAGLGGPSKYWQSYSYDLAGDRTKLVEHGTSAGDRTTEYFPTPGKHSVAEAVTTDNGGSRKASYTYDDTGNTLTRPSPGGGTQTMTWDQEGRVATTVDESGQSSYVYDADGNRLVRRDPEGRTLYLPGQELRYTTSSGAKVCTRYYTHAGQTVAMRTSTGLMWVSADQHGTAQSTITALSQAVSTRRTLPFGEVRGDTGTWPARLDKGFVGGTLDNTGLTHIGAREYDPKLGRFISVDPVMDLADPRQWNAYVYSNNSPVTFSDPTGLYCDSCNFYEGEKSDAGNNVGCGYSPNGLCGPEGSGVSQQEMNQLWQWESGTGDGSNQPIIYGHRLPTAEEMKRGPIFGAPVMMAQDETYAEAVKHWATYLCRSSNPGAGFCEWSYTVGNRPANGWDAVFTVVGAVGLAAGAVGGSALRGAAAASKEAGWLGKAAKAVGRGCEGNSFTGDTQVLMADGSTKRIDEIELGDQVLATDPETGESGAREVTATIIGEGAKFLVEIETGASKIVATGGHPFWLPDQKRWVEAKDLRAGYALQTLAGAQVRVTAIKNRVAITRVHNLTVDDIHAYYALVGNYPVLVHNTCIEEDAFRIGEHVLPRHTPAGALNRGKSVFNEGEDLVELAQKSTTQIGKRQAGTGRIEYVIDAGRVIGKDVHGVDTNTYTVIRTSRREFYENEFLEFGDLVTMHPGTP